MAEQRPLFDEPEPPPVDVDPALVPAIREADMAHGRLGAVGQTAPASPLATVAKGDRVAVVGTDPLLVLTVERAGPVIWTEPDRVTAWSRRWSRATCRERGRGKDAPTIRTATAREIAVHDARAQVEVAQIRASNAERAKAAADSNVERAKRDLSEWEMRAAKMTAQRDDAAVALAVAKAKLAEAEAS